MDPLRPDTGLDGESNDGTLAVKREPGLAPAGSLMTIHIRRRTPPKNRLLGPAAPEPAPVPPRPAPPAPASTLTAPATPPAAAPAPAAAPEIAKRPPEPPAPPRPAVAAPPQEAPRADTPPPAAPRAETPAVTPSVAAPSAEKPPVAPPPVAAPPVTKPPAPTPPVASTPAPTAHAAKPVAAPPVVAVPGVRAGEPGRRTPTATSPVAPALTPSAPAEPDVPSVLASPGIARYARTGTGERPAAPKAAPESSPAARPTPSVAPETKQQDNPPAAAPAPASAPPAAPETVRPEGIVSYWLRLRGSRRYPTKADLDQTRITADWPNSILMRCRSGSKVLEPEKVFAPPAAGASALEGGDSPKAMELSPMMLQWLLTLAADAARDRRPMQDTESFPSLSRSVRYGAFALPFSDDQTRIDHVLCHVYRTP